MQIAIERKQLLVELRKVARGAVKGKPTIPGLACVHIQASTEGSDVKIFLRCTDLAVCIEGAVRGAVERAGVVVVPVKKLIAVLAKLEGDLVRFEAVEGTRYLDITCGRSEFEFAGVMDGENFPQRPPEPDSSYSHHIPAGMLRRLIERTSFAVTGPDARYSLQGALLEIDNGVVRMVGTDAHRLAWAEEVLGLETEVRDMAGVIVDGDSLRELGTLLKGVGAKAETEDVVLQVSDKGRTQLMFRLPGPGDHILWTWLIDGQFPTYDKIMPSWRGGKVEVVVNREELAGVIKRISELTAASGKGSKSRTKVVMLSLPPGDGWGGEEDMEMEVSASDKEVGMAHEKIDIRRLDTGEEPVEVHFNANYLTQYLMAASGDEVVWRFESADRQSVFEPVEADPEGSLHRYIVMTVKR